MSDEEKIERLQGGYQPKAHMEGILMADGKQGTPLKKIVEGYQPKPSDIEKGYKPQQGEQIPKPPTGGTGAQKPKK